MFQTERDTYEESRFEMKLQNVRQKFVTKVFGIVLAQLVCTMLTVTTGFFYPRLFALVEPLQLFLVLAYAGILLALTCSESLARTVPTNYFLLGALTLIQSILVYSTVKFMNVSIVLSACLYTSMLLTALCAFSHYTTSDFTSPAFNLKFLFLQLGLSVVLFFFPIHNAFMVFISGMIFSTYIIIDLQLIMGRKGISFLSDDYILAAITLYTDIIQLYIQIAKLLEGNEKDKKKRH